MPRSAAFRVRRSRHCCDEDDEEPDDCVGNDGVGAEATGAGGVLACTAGWFGVGARGVPLKQAFQQLPIRAPQPCMHLFQLWV